MKDEVGKLPSSVLAPMVVKQLICGGLGAKTLTWAQYGVQLSQRRLTRQIRLMDLSRTGRIEAFNGPRHNEVELEGL